MTGVGARWGGEELEGRKGAMGVRRKRRKGKREKRKEKRKGKWEKEMGKFSKLGNFFGENKIQFMKLVQKYFSKK
jgi:hypothetical protein